MGVNFYCTERLLQKLSKEIIAEVSGVLEMDEPGIRQYVQLFERAFCLYCGMDHGVSLSSGTSALQLGLNAVGVKNGDEVITTPLTYISTGLAITNIGAKPVFVDIDESSLNINPDLIEEKITNKTKAIIPVHLFGNPADMDKICKIAEKHNLKVVEDASQAHGALIGKKNIGCFGDCGCFSFFRHKNLGSSGSGGIAITNTKEVYDKILAMREPTEDSMIIRESGRSPSETVPMDIAVLKIRLKHIEETNHYRISIAEKYKELIKNKDIRFQSVIKDGVHVYYNFVISCKSRDKLLEKLKENDVEAKIPYKVPLHLSKAFSDLGYKKGDFPVAEKAADEMIALPIYPLMTEEEINSVVNSI